MLKFVGTLDGSAPITQYLMAGEVSFRVGDICAWGDSGYVINAASGSCITGLLVGVSEASVAASTITAGTTTHPFQTNPMAIYRANTSAAATRTDVGTNVGVFGGGGEDSENALEESSALTDEIGIFRITKLISTTGTQQVVEGMLNFASPSHV